MNRRTPWYLCRTNALGLALSLSGVCLMLREAGPAARWFWDCCADVADRVHGCQLRLGPGVCCTLEALGVPGLSGNEVGFVAQSGTAVAWCDVGSGRAAAAVFAEPVDAETARRRYSTVVEIAATC